VNIDRKRFGEWVKKERKRKGFKRQEDLVDDVLSQSVISYIESGNGQVSESKCIYLLERLGVDPKKLEEFALPLVQKDDSDYREEIELKLIAAENIIDLVGPDEGNAVLKGLSLPEDPKYLATKNYLTGKMYFLQQNWSKAYYHFYRAIDMIHGASVLSYTNIETVCYHELSRIEYSQNHFQKAVALSEKALSTYNPEGERSYIYDTILVSQVIYLEKVNRIGDAQKLLDKMNQHRRLSSAYYLSRGKEASLNAFEMHAKFLQKGKQYPQAIELALKGIELARIDKMFERSFELWTTLGSIYSEMDKLNLAECCFKTALNLKVHIKRTYLFAYVYTQLGKLYDKQGESGRAEREFKQAIKYSRKTNNRDREVDALLGLGQCYLGQEKYDEALEQLKEALELAKELGLEEKKKYLLLLIGQCLVKMGDPSFQAIALDFFYSNIQSLEGGESMRRNMVGDPPGS
jgi:tetratricopeptide (TPR) repeat protein